MEEGYEVWAREIGRSEEESRELPRNSDWEAGELHRARTKRLAKKLN